MTCLTASNVASTPPIKIRFLILGFVMMLGGHGRADPITYVVSPQIAPVDSELGRLVFSRYSAGDRGERKLLLIELFPHQSLKGDIVFRLFAEMDRKKVLDCLLEIEEGEDSLKVEVEINRDLARNARIQIESRTSDSSPVWIFIPLKDLW